MASSKQNANRMLPRMRQVVILEILCPLLAQWFSVSEDTIHNNSDALSYHDLLDDEYYDKDSAQPAPFPPYNSCSERYVWTYSSMAFYFGFLTYSPLFAPADSRGVPAG